MVFEIHGKDLKFPSREDAAKFLSYLTTDCGHSKIAGLDECGRGPMAGPVVAACVLLPINHQITGIRDSKKLSAKRREVLAAQIMESAIWGIGVQDNDAIDRLNIYKATLKAAEIAIAKCAAQVDIEYLLCDGGLDVERFVEFPTTAVIKGDNWFECIGAASIIAKVYRDKQMALYHEVWPEYGFINNQGYGTKAHRYAIEKYGLTEIHRKSFKFRKRTLDT